jgi:uncharacterized protein (TIGR02453 family)
MWLTIFWQGRYEMNRSLPFEGFPQQTLDFLTELARNNNRDWFEAHKEDYRLHVLAPTRDFVVALGERLKELSPGIRYDPRANGGSILRIYRDLRFSADKTPYNPNVRVGFWEGEGKRMENPSFLARIEPTGVSLYAGIHVFPKPTLKAYREAVVDETLGAELEAAMAAVRKVGDYTLGGEHYKRVPRGYEAEHPRADLLRYNGLWAHTTEPLDAALITTPRLAEACFEQCRNMEPLHRWLVKVQQRQG